jgi:hypothetical protein
MYLLSAGPATATFVRERPVGGAVATGRPLVVMRFQRESGAGRVDIREFPVECRDMRG